MYMVLEMNVLNSISYKRKMFQPKYHWAEIKYLGPIESRCGQLFSLCDNAFSQYMSEFASAMVLRRPELERL